MKVACLSAWLCAQILFFSACETRLETTAALSAAAETQIAPTAYRINKLELRDPHPFAGALFFCTDATDQVNDQIAARIEGDKDEDGFLDLGFSLVFRPLAQEEASNPIEVHVASCTSPAETSACSPGTHKVESAALNQAEGVCLEPIDGTVDYSPAPTLSTGPCFASVPGTISIDVAGIPIMLEAAQVSATYLGDPADGLTQGLLMGFVSEAQANNIVIPKSVPFVGGKKLSSLFPGGKGNCNSGDARDIGPDGKTKGWWLYLNFEAEPTAWTDPPPPIDPGDPA